MSGEYDLTTVRLIDDPYEGVTIDHTSVSSDISTFEQELLSIIQSLNGKKLLWIKLPIERSNMIPILTKYDFVFHHCHTRDITMLKKLTRNPIIPTTANHTLGVGAVVVKENQLLVIKDRIGKKYKLPGGYIDDKEMISHALKREVFEETGIKIEITSVVSLGQSYPSQFDQSNLYIVCTAEAHSHEIAILDSNEIIDARWMGIDEYFNHADIHAYNKDIVRAALKGQGLKQESPSYITAVDRQREYYF